jgi:RNA recognition motif-containing protein
VPCLTHSVTHHDSAVKDDAVQAVQKLNNKAYDGRRLAVTFAEPKKSTRKAKGKPSQDAEEVRLCIFNSP